jgi:hypothetical protein
VLALSLAPAAATPQPRVENGPLQQHAARPSLEGAVRAVLSAQRAPAWLGYEVPAAAQHSACCFESTRNLDSCAGCRLEGMGAFRPRGEAGAGRVGLEAQPRLVVLLRAEAGRVERVEALSYGCALDLGGLTLHWLAGAEPAQSLALLAGLARDRARRGLVEPAVAAIGMHAGREADALLIGMARRDPEREARAEALFWLAQRAGDEAVSTLRAALDDDPEREVKKQAVFALSELPGRTGVPLLIEVAREHRDPEVRREAFFWLGDSEDPRALAFFEQVLVGAGSRR